MSHEHAQLPHLPARTVSPEEVQRRKSYLRITPTDEARLCEAHPRIQSHADEIITRFYDHLLANPFTRSILSNPGVLERLRKIQRAYFERLTLGLYDVDYCEDRMRAGYAHDRIGLSPEWYLGAYHKYLSLVAEVLSRELADDFRAFRQIMESLTKVIHLDMGLAMDAYIDAGQQRLVQRNADLERLDAQKQLLTDTIVHDLRNPIAGIQGFLGVFRDRSGRLETADQSAIDEAERACSMLNTMVDNVLAISRMEEGMLEVMEEAVDLRAIVDQVGNTLRPFAAARGKRLRLVLGADRIDVRTDGVLVQRILLNLVMNSIRHATGASFVEVAAELSADGRVRLCVADDGPGIPREYHAYIFEKYGRTRLRQAGLKLDTGLGLVFCRMAAGELGAEIQLESDLGRGAKFTLVL